MKEKKEIKGKGRRTFLSQLFTGGAVIAATGLLKADAPPAEKLKLLTPDGKLVEVDKSKINNAQGASNKEVKEWMNSKSNKI